MCSLSLHFDVLRDNTHRSGLSVLSSLSTLSMPRILVPELEMSDTRMSMTEINTSIPSRIFQLLLR